MRIRGNKASDFFRALADTIMLILAAAGWTLLVIMLVDFIFFQGYYMLRVLI